MNGRLRLLATVVSAAALTGAAIPCAGALAAEAQTPLAASNYGVRAACRPPRLGHASCLAMRLVPLSARARALNRPIGIRRAAAAAPSSPSPAAGEFGLRPQDIRSAYGLPESAETEQTIALVDAYNDPTAEADLAAYSTMFGLPPCTGENGCFRKVNQTGSSSPSGLPFPKSSEELKAAEKGSAAEREQAEAALGWGAEISLDIETAHATCPNCHILLVEASATSYTDLETAERTAETLGAGEISNSWGGPEEGVSVSHDSIGPFNDQKVVITASTGDNGYLGWDSPYPEERGFTNYPASSPHVVAVGGTRLTLGAGGAWSSETVWNGNGASGGGCSIQFTAPPWQQSLPDWSSIGCATKRVIADVSADADPLTGIAVTDSSSACENEYSEGATTHVIHWCTYGGTSLASPIIAAVFALAGGANGVSYPVQTLYQNEREAPSTLHDVTSGSNGECAAGYSEETGLSSCTPAEEAAASCSSHGSCLAGTGFDGPSGVGTPHGILGFEPHSGETEEALAESPPEEEAPVEVKEEAAHTEGTSTPVPGPTAPPAPAPAPPATSASIAPVISALNLTIRSLVALNARRPWASKVAFSFMLSSASKVRMRLLRHIRVHHRSRWVTSGATATVAGAAGRDYAHLRGHRRLSAGLYRLSVWPVGGRPRSIVFHIN